MIRDRDRIYGTVVTRPTACHGHPRQANCTGLALAEQLCRTADRIDPARVFGPHHCPGRGTSASDSEKLCGLLQRRENASVIEQRCACLSPGSAIRRHKFERHTGGTSSSIRSDLDFRCWLLPAPRAALKASARNRFSFCAVPHAFVTPGPVSPFSPYPS